MQLQNLFKSQNFLNLFSLFPGMRKLLQKLCATELQLKKWVLPSPSSSGIMTNKMFEMWSPSTEKERQVKSAGEGGRPYLDPESQKWTRLTSLRALSTELPQSIWSGENWEMTTTSTRRNDSQGAGGQLGTWQQHYRLYKKTTLESLFVKKK